jgi:hypothetical protein
MQIKMTDKVLSKLDNSYSIRRARVPGETVEKAIKDMERLVDFLDLEA